MHLTATRVLLLAIALTLPAAVQAQQQPQPQQQQVPQMQADPRAQQPESKPIVPEKKPAPPKKKDPNAPRTRSMAFDLPPLVSIAEMPRGKVVMIQGVVQSPQATAFVLNDGNASQVINIGPAWRDLTKVQAGDRVRVIGQMDPYGTQVFRAGSIMLENNKIVVVPTE